MISYRRKIVFSLSDFYATRTSSGWATQALLFSVSNLQGFRDVTFKCVIAVVAVASSVPFPLLSFRAFASFYG